MSRRPAASIVANPILVGAVVTLVIVVGVFLAYNANNGLPFVPTFDLRVETPDASRLVVGNDVREGGFRIGQVAKIDPVPIKGHRTGAELTLALQKSATPLPVMCRTSHIWATDCIQVPVTETNCAPKKRR